MFLRRDDDEAVPSLHSEMNTGGGGGSRPTDHYRRSDEPGEQTCGREVGGLVKSTSAAKSTIEHARIDTVRIAATWLLIAFLLGLIAVEPLLKAPLGSAPATANVVLPSHMRVVRPLPDIAHWAQHDRMSRDSDDSDDDRN